MNTTRLILTALFAALLGNSLAGKAEDIDLYSSAASVTGTDLPNVLFVLDNAAAFNSNNSTPCTYYDGGTPSMINKNAGIEQCALVNAINAMPTNTVNVGIMAYNANGFSAAPPSGWNCNSSGKGGCLMYPLTTMTSTNKINLINLIKGWTASTIAANNEATAQAMQEAWAYYAGKTGMSGTTYTSPALVGCQKNYVIFIGNAMDSSGSPGDASASPDTQLTNTINGNAGLTAAQKTMLNTIIQISAGTYGTTGFTCSPNPWTMGNSHNTANAGLYADEWARYMYDVDLKLSSMPASRRITTYTIGVLSSACKADYPALLTSMAIQGGGKYFPTASADDIKQAILRVLNEVQAVNSVFSSSSLPVSVNAQGTYLNQVFMGMFRPDAAGTPRWKGNLKQYQFIYNSTTQKLDLADATGTAAISAAGTGFLSPNASSFWTCSAFTQAGAPYNVTPYNINPYKISATCSTDPSFGFWANQPNGIGLAWDLPDGEVVEKGGATQMLRLTNLFDDYTQFPGTTSNPRNLYTYCPTGAGCVATLSNPSPNSNAFDTSNGAITDAMLGTGPLAISSITSAATVTPTSTVAGGGGASTTISITALSKSGSTVTATVSAADIAKVSIGSNLNITTGATKYDCNPCTIATVNTGTNQFTYSKTGGSGAPTLPSTATLYSSSVTVNTANPISVGQQITFASCTVLTALNGTVGTITTASAGVSFTAATTIASIGGTTDNTCQYTPNTATVTTSTSHNLPSGATVSIAGATPTNYNGLWTITVTGTNTFTYQYTVAAPLAPFAGAGATVTSSSTTRDALMKWVRGYDNYGDEASLCPPGTTAGTGNCPNPAVTIRPSVHGDVLHSRPVVLNYSGSTVAITGTSDSGTTRTATASATDVAKIGTVNAQANVMFANSNSCQVTVASITTFTYSTTNCGNAGAQTAATSSPNVVAFYGDNDGVFHAVNGNQINPPGSPFPLPNPGGELWGFIPAEFFGKLKRQHDNSPVLQMSSTLPGIVPAPQRKDYFVDGSTGIYQVIDGLGRTTKAYLYLAMRRGGRFLYALDVTDPSNPKFLWRHSNADAGFGELGQTWSQPKVAKVSGYPAPVLIFGAGYDATAEDMEPPATDTMGRGIFILDAATGALVWKATYGASLSCPNASAACTLPAMSYSIPSDSTLLDRNNDGKIDRLYVGDVGGNVWRIDLEPVGGNTPDKWQVEKLAALGCSTGPCAAGTTPRKIFYPPEVIATQGYDAVFIATGDREHPLYTDPTSTAITPNPFLSSPPYNVSACGVTNRAYFLKDLATGMDGSGNTIITEQPGTAVNLVPDPNPYNGTLGGYYVTFQSCEKSVNAPLVTAGYIYFGTNQAKKRSDNTCEETLGEATGYKLAPFSGKYVAGEFEGGGLPPSPVSGIVNVVDSVTGKTMQVPFCIGCGGEADNGGNTGCGSESALAGCKPPISVSSRRSRTYWYIKDK